MSEEITVLVNTLRELAAIRSTAEDAAGRILESAEGLLAFADKEEAKKAEEAILAIMTACGFHDLVGQRVTKITETLDRVIATRMKGADRGRRVEAQARQRKSKADPSKGPAIPVQARTSASTRCWAKTKAHQLSARMAPSGRRLASANSSARWRPSSVSAPASPPLLDGTCSPLATNTASIPKLAAPAMSVFTPSPMARTWSLAMLSPARAAMVSSARAIDRRMRLAGIEHAAPYSLIERRERAGAIDEAVAALDQMIGIGADHGELPRGECAQEPNIVVRRLGLVVEQARADHELGVVSSPELDGEALEDRQVALRPEMKHHRALMLGELVAGEVARGDGGVIGIVGDAETAELLLNARARARRVGEEHHDAARRAKASRGGNGAGERPDARYA